MEQSTVHADKLWAPVEMPSSQQHLTNLYVCTPVCVSLCVFGAKYLQENLPHRVESALKDLSVIHSVSYAVIQVRHDTKSYMKFSNMKSEVSALIVVCFLDPPRHNLFQFRARQCM